MALERREDELYRVGGGGVLHSDLTNVEELLSQPPASRTGREACWRPPLAPMPVQ
jgi:hypothetical protein